MRILSVVWLVLGGCGGGGGGGGDGHMDPDAGPMAPVGIAVLGSGTHDVANVEVTVVADAEDGVSFPRDLAFDPERPGTLYVLASDQTLITILSDVGTPMQDWRRPTSPGAAHFMPHPSALAFGAPGTFATIHDEEGITQPMTPVTFMGPTLWPSDPAIYDGGEASHMDMLHNSPGASGLAWERDNAYWAFDRVHMSLTRYDFQMDHGYGGTDHSDGIVARYVEGEVLGEVAVSSHLVFDHERQLLYVADTGHGRIAVLDPSTGTRGAPVEPNYDGTDQHRVDGAVLTTLVDGAAVGLIRPSGIALHDGVLYVTDHATSMVSAFTREGELLDYVSLSTIAPPDSLQGIDVDSNGHVFLADAAADRVIRLSPR